MEFSGENILIILLVGLVIGLLPSMFVERTRGGFVRDVACGIGGIVVAALLTLAWRDASTIKLWLTKSAKDESANLAPPYEPVVLPLSPLRPLLKPVVYRSREEICDALARATRSNDLPAHFFIRLLYQESNFRLAAISSAGALGIAQFMPETASDRGLDNPFDALQAIPASLSATCASSSAISASPLRPTMPAPDVLRIGARTRVRCRRKRRTTSRPSRAGRRRRGPMLKRAVQLSSFRARRPARNSPACLRGMGRTKSRCRREILVWRKLRIRQRLSRSPPNRVPMRRLKRAKPSVR